MSERQLGSWRRARGNSVGKRTRRGKRKKSRSESKSDGGDELAPAQALTVCESTCGDYLIVHSFKRIIKMDRLEHQSELFRAEG
mmetsp:Transcript_23685/g.37014  ORF Transcript_23685/g.37014 Transcript_23685/m.37014 type:complete len:84 (-) Transcript_23685:884-1135(-)